MSFLLALTIFILKHIQDSEFVILWTSGVKKIHLVNLFLFFSFFITILYLVFSTFITPLALNKSRQLLSSEDLTSFLPTIKVQQFTDSFRGVTFIVDEKMENWLQVYNWMQQMSTPEDYTTNTQTYSNKFSDGTLDILNGSYNTVRQIKVRVFCR